MYRWKHKKDVKEMYVKTFVKDHRNFKVARSGVVVDLAHLIFCDCCGQGASEKKLIKLFVNKISQGRTQGPECCPRVSYA